MLLYMIFPIYLLTKLQIIFLCKALGCLYPNKLLIEFTGPVMQTSEGVHIRLIDCVLAHNLWVETEMEVAFEEIVFIGRLSSKAMYKDYRTLVPPDISGH